MVVFDISGTCGAVGGGGGPVVANNVAVEDEVAIAAALSRQEYTTVRYDAEGGGLLGVAVGIENDAVLSVDAGSNPRVTLASLSVHKAIFKQVGPFRNFKYPPSVAIGGNDVGVGAPIDKGVFIVLLVDAAFQSPIGAGGAPVEEVTVIVTVRKVVVGLILGKMPYSSGVS